MDLLSRIPPRDPPFVVWALRFTFGRLGGKNIRDFNSTLQGLIFRGPPRDPPLVVWASRVTLEGMRMVKAIAKSSRKEKVQKDQENLVDTRRSGSEPVSKKDREVAQQVRKTRKTQQVRKTRKVPSRYEQATGWPCIAGAGHKGP